MIYMDLISVLQTPESKFVLMPIVTIIAGVIIKQLCQNDKIDKSSRDLFYWTPNFLVSNFILICGEFSNHIDKVEQLEFTRSCFNAMILNVVGGAFICLWIRRWGWNVNQNYLRVWRGIFIPNVYAIILMYVVLKTILS